MSSGQSSQLLRCAPYFPVADVEQSATYYERVLGFRREYAGGTPPRFAIVSRDGLPVMFRVVPAPERVSPNEYQMEEFAVRDGDGYVLGFGQPVARS